jgi:hypothetical protein
MLNKQSAIAALCLLLAGMPLAQAKGGSFGGSSFGSSRSSMSSSSFSRTSSVTRVPSPIYTTVSKPVGFGSFGSASKPVVATHIAAAVGGSVLTTTLVQHVAQANAVAAMSAPAKSTTSPANTTSSSAPAPTAIAASTPSTYAQGYAPQPVVINNQGSSHGVADAFMGASLSNMMFRPEHTTTVVTPAASGITAAQVPNHSNILVSFLLWVSFISFIAVAVILLFKWLSVRNDKKSFNYKL